ncbi:malate:quinone oxidoreductase [Massilia yuzhufengensis]|uniref:malate dehydrogenase (quinone) n=1 Tax=Massilia yuzhufengensis TaxID=1164594 RepID=A0A1I1N556_9BURK|nr:malate:quinone oxidoreductase [Massilia yuzhufengensis]SFC92804.1 malate dehydrogenase (quinone) [Massilia yuzhufengensis]
MRKLLLAVFSCVLLASCDKTPIMLKVLQSSSFKDRSAGAAWQAKPKEMVPSYGQKRNADPALANRIRQHSSSILGLKAVTLAD